MEKIKVEVVKYKANDGKVFDNIDDCKLHEKRLSGDIRTCTNCNGEKEVDNYGDGSVYHICTQCNGKGYQEKQTIWK